MIEGLFLLVAGFLGGVVNAIAGGGSFITFPALLFVGIPPISANASNTFASCAGYLSGAYALRRELATHRQALPKILIISLLGGAVGGWLLLQTPESVFETAIPWLLLFATVLFIFGAQLNSALRRFAGGLRHASMIGAWLSAAVLLVVCIYGGFFNAGLGIIALSYLVLAGYQDINLMNGIKLLVSSAVSVIAIAIFIYHQTIAWYAGSLVFIGTLAGGYVAAHLSRQLPQAAVRKAVTIASIVITVYFFIKTYG